MSNLHTKLVELIKRRIAEAGGTISFSEYMNLALYAQGLGYYSGGETKFGVSGDFVTAPEISPLFGRCLARFARSVLLRIPGGSILEFGAGTGRLAATLLTELRVLGHLPERYYILEVSADLRYRQQEFLREYAGKDFSRFVWLSELPAYPFDGLVVANEVLDAMPVNCFELTDEGIWELGVGWEGSQFIWRPIEIRENRLEAAIQCALVPNRLELVPPYRSEVNLLISPWIASIADFLRSAAVLCIDYGYPRAEYYHPQRRSGTLICHYKHVATAYPLTRTGQQDITASVDFTAVAEAGVENGLSVSAYTTLANFLIYCELPALLTEAAEGTPEEFDGYRKAAKTFLLPGEMGERFKVLLLTKNFEAGEVIATLIDQRHAL